MAAYLVFYVKNSVRFLFSFPGFFHEEEPLNLSNAPLQSKITNFKERKLKKFISIKLQRQTRSAGELLFNDVIKRWLRLTLRALVGVIKASERLFQSRFLVSLPYWPVQKLMIQCVWKEKFVTVGKFRRTWDPPPLPLHSLPGLIPTSEVFNILFLWISYSMLERTFHLQILFGVNWKV